MKLLHVTDKVKVVVHLTYDPVSLFLGVLYSMYKDYIVKPREKQTEVEHKWTQTHTDIEILHLLIFHIKVYLE